MVNPFIPLRCIKGRFVEQTCFFQICRQKKKATTVAFKEKALAMTYFHMGKPHTIIGARMFHF
ncbi:hypothetical protein, partial [Legionella adelaidensis]|uniref:hypothetical protein n=1 Tax=Legionella adelaidensis TaxID=45056 RepID=UPI001F32A85B